MNSLPKRVMIVTFMLLVTLCGYQWRSLRLMKSQIARLSDASRLGGLAAEYQFTAARLDEVQRALTWLDEYYRSADGLKRAQGLCSDGRLDTAGPAVWLYGTYLRRRLEGASEGIARQEVLNAVKLSDEWRSLHSP